MAIRKEQQEKLDELRREQFNDELTKFAVFVGVALLLGGFWYWTSGDNLGPPGTKVKTPPAASTEKPEAEEEAPPLPEPEEPDEPKAVVYQSGSLQFELSSKEREAERARQLEEEKDREKGTPAATIMVD